MRILITTGIYEPEAGGPAIYAPELARGLVRAGHTVKVITYSDKAEYDFDSEYSFPLMRIVRKGKLLNYFNFFRAVFRELRHYDFVYSLDWVSAGVPVNLACSMRKKPYLLRVGGGYIWEKYLQQGKEPVTLQEFYKKGLYKKYPLLFSFIKNVFLGAEKIVFNAGELGELLSQYYSLPKEKVAIIENPVPELSLEVRRSTPSDEIIFAGRFIVMKNIESLLEAFKKAGLSKETTLTLIGSGPREFQLRALIGELGIEGRVKIEPSMRREELYKRIINCKYAVIPSWTDIAPNQVSELLSLGIPFLLTRENYLSFKDSIPLMIDPHSVSDIQEKMERLEKKSEYEKLNKALESIPSSHSWDDVVKEHLTLFTSLQQ